MATMTHCYAAIAGNAEVRPSTLQVTQICTGYIPKCPDTKKRTAFLAELAAGGSVQRACLAAGIGRSAAYTWRENDEDFAAAPLAFIGHDFSGNIDERPLSLRHHQAGPLAAVKQHQAMEIVGSQGSSLDVMDSQSSITVNLQNSDLHAFSPLASSQ
jgi:hypothetical protein